MYDQIARYYDQIHAHLTADIGYALTLAEQAAGPVLELGCGSGRLLLPLARAGHTVTGVDNEPAMLTLAQQKLEAEPAAVQERVRLITADMASLTLPAGNGRFSLTLIAYNTFMHLAPAQMKTTLQEMKQYLSTNGRLFIDLSNPFVVAATPDDAALTLETTFTDPETGELVLQLAHNLLDEAAQTLHVTWIYDASSPAGGPVQRTVVPVDYHYLYPHELELMLNDAGFRLEALYGDYSQAPFSEQSRRLLALARCL